MNRSTWASLFVCTVGLSFALSAFAQTPTAAKTQKAAPPNIHQTTKIPWETIKVGGENIKVLRFFEKKAKCPDLKDRPREIAALELSDPLYKEYLKGPEAFANKFGVFTCKVTGALEHAKRSAATAKEPPDTDPRVLFVVHDPDCGGIWY